MLLMGHDARPFLHARVTRVAAILITPTALLLLSRGSAISVLPSPREN